MDLRSSKLPPKLFTLKGLRARGRRYSRGDVFPWRDLGITERRALQLLDQRWLCLVHPDQLLKEKKAEEAAKRKAKAEATKKKSKKKSKGKKAAKPKEDPAPASAPEAKTEPETAAAAE